jgi:hypothetical protein
VEASIFQLVQITLELDKGGNIYSLPWEEKEAALTFIEHLISLAVHLENQVEEKMHAFCCHKVQQGIKMLILYNTTS